MMTERTKWYWPTLATTNLISHSRRSRAWLSVRKRTRILLLNSQVKQRYPPNSRKADNVIYVSHQKEKTKVITTKRNRMIPYTNRIYSKRYYQNNKGGQ